MQPWSRFGFLPRGGLRSGSSSCHSCGVPLLSPFRHSTSASHRLRAIHDRRPAQEVAFFTPSSASSTEYSRPWRHSEASGSSVGEHLPFLHVLNEPPSSRAPLHYTDKGKARDHNSGRIEAYQHLRTHAPSLLARITDDGLNALCVEAASEALTEVVEQILADFAPPEDILSHRHSLYWIENSNGIFNAPRGTLRRCHALQSLLSASLAGCAFDHHNPSQSWSGVQKLSPRITASAMKRASLLLMQDVSLLSRRSLKDASAILSHMDPIVARWLMMTIAKNSDTSLVTLINDLWQRVNVASFPGCDFPTPVEADALCRFYLSLGHLVGEEDVQLLHLGSDAGQAPSKGRPASLLVVAQVIDALRQAHPALLPHAVLAACDETADRFYQFLSRYGFEKERLMEKKERFRVRSILSVVAAHAQEYDLADRWLVEMETELEEVVRETKSEMATLFLLNSARYVLRSTTSTRTDALRGAEVVQRLLPVLIGAAVRYRHSPDILWFREYCERTIAYGDIKRAMEAIELASRQLIQDGEECSSLASLLGSDNALLIAKSFANQRDSPALVRFLQSIGLLDPTGRKLLDDQDKTLTTEHRTQLIIACARSRLAPLAIQLYRLWVAPRAGKWDKKRAQRQLSVLMSPKKRVIKAVSKNVRTSVYPAISIKQSSLCMAAMVQMLTVGKRPVVKKDFVGEEDVTSSTDAGAVSQSGQGSDDSSAHLPGSTSLAYQALFVFMEAKPFEMWEIDDLLNLAKSLFRLGHDREAYLCIADVHLRKQDYSSDVLAVLVQGMAQMDLYATCVRVEEWATWDSFASSIDESVIAPVLTQALLKRRLSLAARMVTLAQKQGVGEKMAIRSMAGLLFTVMGGIQQKKMLQLANVPQAYEHEQGKEEEGQVNRVIPSERTEQDNIFHVWRWIRQLIERDEWRVEPNLVKWMVWRCAKASQELRPSNRYLSDQYYLLASRFLRSSATRLQYIGHGAAMNVLKLFDSNLEHVAAKDRSLYQQKRIIELDRLTAAIRWTQMYAVDRRSQPEMRHLLQLGKVDEAIGIPEEEEDHALAVKVATGDHGQERMVNKLPVTAFRALILAYLRLGDALGAASVLAYARDECRLTLAELEKGWVASQGKRGFKNLAKDALYSAHKRGSLDDVQEALAWFSGQEPVPHVKSWWEPPRMK